MKKNLAVIALFIILIIVMTYPLILNFSTAIPGFFSTDEPYSSIWDSWRIRYSVANHLSLTKTNLISYPFGYNFYPAGYSAYVWMGWHHLLSLLANPVVAHNIQVLFNMFLSGIFAYALVLYLSKSMAGAIFSGIIFAFCPYQFVRAWQHLGLTYNEWIPLAILSAILLREIPNRKHKILFFFSLILLFSFDFVIMYLVFISLMTYFLYLLFYDLINLKRRKDQFASDLKYFKNIIFVGFTAFILLSAQFIPLIVNRITLSFNTQASTFNVYRRPFEDLFAQSARPLSYFLPASMHPVFGKFTEQFLGSSLYGISFTEHTIYLGWIPLILAFVAVRNWRKNRKETKRNLQDFYIGFFLLLAITALLFSQPPWWQIGPLKIYMPSFFMYNILPMFRAYCRFGIVVMIAVAVLAGFGLKFMLDRFKSNNVKAAFTILLCGLVLFEFWNWPPYKVIDVSKFPQVYSWLKRLPGDFVIAEYPLDSDGVNEMYRFYQTKHEKKIINWTIPGTQANKVANTIKSLSDPKTAGTLKWLGVSYVIVHRDGYLKTEIVEEIEELQRIPNNPHLKLIKSFLPEECPDKNIMCLQKTGPIDVYLVEATPIEPAVKNK